MRDVGEVGFRAGFRLRDDCLVDDEGLAGYAVELVADRAAAILVRRADGNQADNEDLALLDVDGNFFAGFKSVKERGGREHTHIAGGLEVFREVREHRRIHQVRVKIVVGGGAFEFIGEIGARFGEVDRGGRGGVFLLRIGEVFRASCLVAFFAEDHEGDWLRPAAFGPAETPAHHVDHGLRERNGAGFEVDDVGGLDAAAEEEQRHVADDFRRRRDFHDVTEELIHVGVAASDLGPAMGDAHGVGLLLEVGVLAAGHLVEIDLGRAAFRRGVEGRVE